MIEVGPDRDRVHAGGDGARSAGAWEKVDDGRADSSGSDALTPASEVVADEYGAVAFERESGVNATDSLRFRPAPDPVAAGAEADGTDVVIFSSAAHMDSVVRLRAVPTQARPRPVRTESGMRQGEFGMMRAQIGPHRGRSHAVGAQLDLYPSRVQLVFPRRATLRTRCRPSRTRCTPRRARCDSMAVRSEM
jgi:hypothetical protein